eukprot:TRINITY_DN62022_c0_g1_i1.p1 TRINITY_DN62022_c0_g1~~TRINITY_DN62022_c0_g1_i1.p1  ORF type:complete len:829 (+),score=152.08 TRINITY_DN62022_c0_g1_i1:39-2525(+)
MALFKNLVAQLVQEYEHIAGDVGRLLGENDQLREKYEHDQHQLQNKIANLQDELHRLRDELERRPVIRPTLPGPPLPEAGVEMATSGQVTSPVEPEHVNNGDFSDSNPLAKVDLHPAAALNNKLQTRRVIPRKKQVQPSFQDWIQESRARLVSKTAAKEITRASTHVFAQDALHASQPEQLSAGIDVIVYRATGLSKEPKAEGCSRPPRFSLVAHLDFEERRLEWTQSIEEAAASQPGQLADDTLQLCVEWGDKESGATLCFAAPNPQATEVELEVFQEGVDTFCGRVRLPISSRTRQLWAMEGGGFLECELCQSKSNDVLDEPYSFGNAAASEGFAAEMIEPDKKHRGPLDKCVLVLSSLSMTAAVLSFVFLGISLDRHPKWPGWTYIEMLWAVIFTLEVLGKLAVHGCGEFFCGSENKWNMADVFLTGVAVFDVMVSFVAESSSSTNVILILRALRLARLTRLVKLMRIPLLAELASMISGFVIGAPWLFWVLVVLWCVIYICAVALRSFILTVVPENLDCGQGDATDLYAELPDGCKIHYIYGEEYCGAVLTCMFTIFRCMIGDCSTTGGRSLSMILSDGFGVRFDLLYSFSMVVVLFGVFNIITAIFVEATLSGLKYNDAQRKYQQLSEQSYIKTKLRELSKAAAARVRKLRGRVKARRASQRLLKTLRLTHKLTDDEEELEEDEDILMNEAEFIAVLRCADVRKALEKIDVTIEPRAGTFNAFNTDRDGFVSIKEMVQGVLKLRGELQKSDIVATQNALRSISRCVAEIQHCTEQGQEYMMTFLENMSTELLPPCLESEKLPAPPVDELPRLPHPQAMPPNLS